MQEENQLLEEKYGGARNPHYDEDRKRLAGGEPLAYVIGWQPFLGLKVHLDSRPLIPRPETEWWTERLLTELDPNASIKFLDLCSGSGAVGCAALARLPNARVYFGELDPAHEPTIRKNIRENGLDASRATIGMGDLFEPFGDERFDIIAANPPYVPQDRVLPASVALYEPPVALFAGESGLDVIRRIALLLPKHLARGGSAWVECDRGHAEATRALFEEQGFRADIRTDQYGKPRIVVVSFPQ
jgi:release factor glutamine methyltransferase